MANESLSCAQKINSVDGLNENELTVGRHLTLECSGDWDKSFDFTKAALVIEESNKYQVRVLKAEARTVLNFDVDVAFYSAGEYKFPDFVISDGTKEIHLGQQNMNVVSVVEQPKEPGKQPEPYGMILPLKLTWPGIYLLISVCFAVCGLVLLVYLIQQKIKFKKLLKKISDYESSIAPDRQFYKAIRQAELKQYPLSDLEHAFRFYIARVYKVPAFDLNDRALLRFFKKQNPWYKKERLELKKLLEDFKVLAKSSESDLLKEKNSFVQKLYKFVDRSEDLMSKKVTS